MRSFTERNILELARNLQWGGSGIKEDPFIIESPNGLPSHFQLQRSRLYIVIRNCNFHQIELRKAQNIVIKDCTAEILMYHCSDVKIDNCTVSTLFLEYCSGLLVKDSLVEKMFKYYSRANQFQNNTIKDQSIIEKSGGCHIILIIALIVTVVGFLASGFIIQNLFTLILSISVMLIFIAIIVPYYRNFRMLKKLPLD
ncbi:MAG: hypothetical protein ACFFCY_03190 [Promethearchaeota archaeon]